MHFFLRTFTYAQYASYWTSLRVLSTPYVYVGRKNFRTQGHRDTRSLLCDFKKASRLFIEKDFNNGVTIVKLTNSYYLYKSVRHTEVKTAVIDR